MKKVFFIAIFTILGFLQSEAQVRVKPGVKAGLNVSKFTNSEMSSKKDFYLGGLLNIKFNKIYTLQPELIYSKQGAFRTMSSLMNYDPTVSNQNRKVAYSIDYLSLSAMSQFTVGDGFHFVVGPSLDFKVSDNFSENYASDPIGFDLAFVGGIGYSFPNGLSLDARFKQGLVDIFGNNFNANYDTNGNGNYDEIVLNQLLQLGVSYSFDLK
jgi:hypothetical protein